jgi:hypothetical protein
MTRGRLIFPFFAKLIRFDAEATGRDDNGPRPLPAGFDSDFCESVVDASTAVPRWPSRVDLRAGDRGEDGD